MSAVRVLGALDHSFGWDGERLVDAGEEPAVLRGAAAAVEPVGGGWRILRDPLGINKLFWAYEGDGAISFAARPSRLVAAGHSLGEVRAVPRGAVFHLPGADERSLVPEEWSAPPTAEPEAAAGGDPRDARPLPRRGRVRAPVARRPTSACPGGSTARVSPPWSASGSRTPWR